MNDKAPPHDPATGEIIEPGHLISVPDSMIYRNPMPPDIARAIVEVKKKVKTLGYDDNNKFQSYQYVSIDKFLDVIGRLEADAGLLLVLDEVSTDIKEYRIQTDRGDKVSNWLHVEYDIMIYHQSGAGYGPIRRKVIVLASGAQAFGSAQSYILKQFQRALYSVPTGEKDADAEDQLGMGAAHRPPPPQRPQEARQESTARPSTDQTQAPQQATPKPAAPEGMSKEDRDKHNAVYNEIRKEIAAARTYFDVGACMTKHEGDLRALEAVGFSVAAKKLRDSADSRKKQLQPDSGVPDGYGNEEIPT